MFIKVFTFNPIQENTYLLYDETNECIIIDAGCLFPFEEEEVVAFIEENNLTLKRVINTHCHFDHIFGNAFIAKKYGVLPEAHQDDEFFIALIEETVRSYGFQFEVTPQALTAHIKEGDVVSFGNANLEAILVPGHSPGSLCFYNKENAVLISGDVLFKDSIGRSDFRGGDYATLVNGITKKLLVLPGETVVYPGHGGTTTIAYEKQNNPYL